MFLVILLWMRQEQEPYRFVRCDGNGSITVLEHVSTGHHVSYDFTDYDPGRTLPHMLRIHDRSGELVWDDKWRYGAYSADLRRREEELRRQREDLRRRGL